MTGDATKVLQFHSLDKRYHVPPPLLIKRFLFWQRDGFSGSVLIWGHFSIEKAQTERDNPGQWQSRITSNPCSRAIRHFHGCESSHIKTEQVIELFNDKVVWNGEVEVFALLNYPGAKRCYAWAYFEDERRTQKKIVTILEIPLLTRLKPL